MAPPLKPGANATLLLVDPYVDNRDMYALYLEHKGYSVLLATNGEEALESIETQAPDLVVMDISLPPPGIDGLEVTRRIKAAHGSGKPIILVLTSHAMKADERDAHAAGCNAFLVKPCLPDDLVVAIEGLLSNSSFDR